MYRLSLALPLSLSFVLSGCDSNAAPKTDPAVEARAKEEAEYEERRKKRKEEREAKVVADKKAEEDLLAKIEEVTVIPEGTKIPKKASEACDQVVAAQRAFMGKYHPDIDEAGLTTQLGMLAKQCNEMGNATISMCQKFALEATTEELSPKINEYLPVCMRKYGDDAKAEPVPPKGK
jgi:hypothetical protein